MVCDMTNRWTPVDLELAARATSWCSTAENPPCTAWCPGDHDPDDFRVSGSLICSIEFGHRVAVQVVQVGDEDEPGRVDVYPPEVVLLDERREFTIGDAAALADALRLAGHFAAGVA